MLRLWPHPGSPTAPPRSAPTATLKAGTLSDTGASLDVTATGPAPTAGWASFELEPCPASGAGPCLAKQPCTKQGDTSACALAGLSANTQYTVKVAALTDAGQRSLEGSLGLQTLLT